MKRVVQLIKNKSVAWLVVAFALGFMANELNPGELLSSISLASLTNAEPITGTVWITVNGESHGVSATRPVYYAHISDDEYHFSKICAFLGASTPTETTLGEAIPLGIDKPCQVCCYDHGVGPSFYLGSSSNNSSASLPSTTTPPSTYVPEREYRYISGRKFYLDEDVWCCVGGKSFHTWRYCGQLTKAKTKIYKTDVEGAIDDGKGDPCDYCALD